MGEGANLPILMDDFGHYMLTFQAFASLSDKVSDDARWVDEIFAEAVAAKINVDLGDQEELRVLGIGSGSGEMDCAMLGKLQARFPRISNRVVEPNPDMLARYQSLAHQAAEARQAGTLGGVAFDWRRQTMEEYAEGDDGTRFHFISAVHCLYHMEGTLDAQLTTMYDRVEPGGVILVVINSEKSQYTHFLHHLSSVLGHFDVFTSSHVQAALDRRGIPYAQHPHRARLRICPCFDEASEEGALLLDFLTNINHFRRLVSEHQRAKVLECLSDADFSERTGEGEILLNIDWDAIVIRKPLA